jgi:hypothetical protein
MHDIKKALAIAFKRHAVAFIIFAFCWVNLGWSLVGDWSMSFGGVSYNYVDAGWRSSGLLNCRGYLVIAFRQSSYMTGGMLPADWKSRQPIRRVLPWSVTASMNIGPSMFDWKTNNGILDDRPRVLCPGIVENWQSTGPGTEFYNRGFAIHWAWLAALASLVPMISIIRARRLARPGCCIACGYDLRATPDRCPECGTLSTVKISRHTAKPGRDDPALFGRDES